MLIFTYYLITQNATLRLHSHTTTHMPKENVRHGKTLQVIKPEKKKH